MNKKPTTSTRAIALSPVQAAPEVLWISELGVTVQGERHLSEKFPTVLIARASHRCHISAEENSASPSPRLSRQATQAQLPLQERTFSHLQALATDRLNGKTNKHQASLSTGLSHPRDHIRW